MASRNLSKKQPAKNIGANPPVKRINYADGTFREEKLNPIPNNKKMVDPDGNVISVSLATGFTIRKANEYGTQILREKLEKGFIPYDECPVATGRVKFDAKKDSACEGKFSRDHACRHVEQIIKTRRAIKQKKEAELKLQYATQQDKMIELLLAQNARLNKDDEQTGGSLLGK